MTTELSPADTGLCPTLTRNWCSKCSPAKSPLSSLSPSRKAQPKSRLPLSLTKMASASKIHFLPPARTPDYCVPLTFLLPVPKVISFPRPMSFRLPRTRKRSSADWFASSILPMKRSKGKAELRSPSRRWSFLLQLWKRRRNCLKSFRSLPASFSIACAATSRSNPAPRFNTSCRNTKNG